MKKSKFSLLLSFFLVLLVSSQVFGQYKEAYSLDKVNSETEYLYLYDKGLKEFPAKILSCTKLKLLSLSGNNLTSLPKEIAQLRNLEYLDLTNNKLTSIPNEILQIKNLMLSLGGNPDISEEQIRRQMLFNRGSCLLSFKK